MSPEQALDTLDEVSAQAPVARHVHVSCVEAVRAIQGALQELAALKLIKVAEAGNK